MSTRVKKDRRLSNALLNNPAYPNTVVDYKVHQSIPQHGVFKTMAEACKAIQKRGG